MTKAKQQKQKQPAKKTKVPQVNNPRYSVGSRPNYTVATAPRPPRFVKAMSDAGYAVGHKIGSVLGGVFGMGAYKLRQNSVMDSISQQVPFMHSASESVVFRHREYIADVSSSTSFSVVTYAVNPGLAATFPYLSAIAQNFQEYEFRGLVFEFKSLSADALNSTNTALGSIALAVQYRADASAFIDKQQLLNEMWAVDGKPSIDILLPVECAPVENPLKMQYVRGAAVPSGQDTKLYDLAKLSVASYGSQAVAVVGELWATYEVVLRKPQLSSGLNIYGLSAHYYSVDKLSDGNPFIGASVRSDSIGLTVTATTIAFPVGTQGLYLIAASWDGTGTAVSVVLPTLGITPSSSSIAPVPMADGTFKLTAPQPSTSNKALTLVYFARITDPTVVTTLTFSGGTFCDVTGDAYMDLIVTQCALGLT